MVTLVILFYVYITANTTQYCHHCLLCKIFKVIILEHMRVRVLGSFQSLNYVCKNIIHNMKMNVFLCMYYGVPVKD